MALDIGGLLSKYLNAPAGHVSADAEDHFDQIAQQASPQVVGQGISDALRSDQTPALGELVSRVYSNATPNQQAGMLNQILASLPQGAFTTHVVNGRLNVNVTNKWLTTTLSQFDSASSRTVLFFRLNYIFRPGDNLFFVFNQATQPGAVGGRQRDRAVLLKWTYALDF